MESKLFARYRPSGNVSLTVGTGRLILKWSELAKLRLLSKKLRRRRLLVVSKMTMLLSCARGRWTNGGTSILVVGAIASYGQQPEQWQMVVCRSKGTGKARQISARAQVANDSSFGSLHHVCNQGGQPQRFQGVGHIEDVYLEVIAVVSMDYGLQAAYDYLTHV